MGLFDYAAAAADAAADVADVVFAAVVVAAVVVAAVDVADVVVAAVVTVAVASMKCKDCQEKQKLKLLSQNISFLHFVGSSSFQHTLNIFHETKYDALLIEQSVTA